jgi:hypothetical protein
MTKSLDTWQFLWTYVVGIAVGATAWEWFVASPLWKMRKDARKAKEENILLVEENQKLRFMNNELRAVEKKLTQDLAKEILENGMFRK